MRVGLLWVFWGVISCGGGPKGAYQDLDMTRDPDVHNFSYQWKNHKGEEHSVAFGLNAAQVEADMRHPVELPRDELNGHIIQAIRAWSATLPASVTIQAQQQGEGVRLNASGPSADVVKPALEQGRQVQEAARREWLQQNYFTTVQSGAISFDHARLVAAYAPQLRPAAEALKAGTTTPREFMRRALPFVQSIPYEKKTWQGPDPGYRRPLALLERNQGDCDGKTVLFLSLVKAAYPEIDLAVIYVPGHTLGAVSIAPEAGDQMFEFQGKRFVYVEPVGPGLHPLGQTAPENRQAARGGEVRWVPSR